MRSLIQRLTNTADDYDVEICREAADRIEQLERENAELQTLLKTSMEQHEIVGRLHQEAVAENAELRKDAARYKKLVAMEEDLVEPVTIWHHLRNPDGLDAAIGAAKKD